MGVREEWLRCNTSRQLYSYDIYRINKTEYMREWFNFNSTWRRRRHRCRKEWQPNQRIWFAVRSSMLCRSHISCTWWWWWGVPWWSGPARPPISFIIGRTWPRSSARRRVGSSSGIVCRWACSSARLTRWAAS